MSQEMFIPEGRHPSQKAIMECARAMQHFLKLGWRKSDMPQLEKLWWIVRDDSGKVAHD